MESAVLVWQLQGLHADAAKLRVMVPQVDAHQWYRQHLVVVWRATLRAILQCLLHMPQFWPKFWTFAVLSAVRKADSNWGMFSKLCDTKGRALAPGDHSLHGAHASQQLISEGEIRLVSDLLQPDG